MISGLVKVGKKLCNNDGIKKTCYITRMAIFVIISQYYDIIIFFNLSWQ